MEELLKIDCDFVNGALVRFLRENFDNEGFDKGVVGLSGGLDSSVTAFLAAQALGDKNVTGVLMPYRTSTRDSNDDAMKVVETLGINHYKIDISPMVDAFFLNFPDADRVRRGNKMARERMSILYDISKFERSLVLGTSNKTEIILGYGTLHGDVASAINPLSDLYKTQIRQLARHIGVPDEIVNKPPSAGLWEGQTDEEELGFSYEEVDRYLFLKTDRKYDRDKLLESGFAGDFISRVSETVKRNEFKGRGTITRKLF
ncbi:NAD+ synthase [candidate division KSB1 bacterium]